MESRKIVPINLVPGHTHRHTGIENGHADMGGKGGKGARDELGDEARNIHGSICKTDSQGSLLHSTGSSALCSVTT